MNSRTTNCCFSLVTVPNVSVFDPLELDEDDISDVGNINFILFLKKFKRSFFYKRLSTQHFRLTFKPLIFSQPAARLWMKCAVTQITL